MEGIGCIQSHSLRRSLVQEKVPFCSEALCPGSRSLFATLWANRWLLVLHSSISSLRCLPDTLLTCLHSQIFCVFFFISQALLGHIQAAATQIQSERTAKLQSLLYHQVIVTSGKWLSPPWLGLILCDSRHCTENLQGLSKVKTLKTTNSFPCLLPPTCFARVQTAKEQNVMALAGRAPSLI